MKKRCVCTVNGTFVTLAEEEIISRFDTKVTNYVKYFFPIYEYYVDNKRYKVQSSRGIDRANESLI